MDSDEPMGLRARTRNAVREELMAAALDVFAAKGYDSATVEEIAATVGLSKRSFFRYFGSKEDVVLGNLEAMGQSLAARLAERPPHENPWRALRETFAIIVEHNDRDPQRTLPLLRMLEEAPALKARHLEKQSRWCELLAPAIASRLPAWTDSGPDPRPVALAGAALACLDSAQAAWLAQGGTTALSPILNRTMAAVAPLEPAAPESRA
ncbi:TetR/AcrR family transcriptional regulator [Nocardia sp. alder85J]|uniref:TetR/AcrR family transcriptional regulator n=1 Tax=Nocardia sp. alder85J TaxID=2862949 RepID=UPI001CD287CB|nr:TetR/AcrR family transcriptional regulator [Nocardia sp. alder85J]MCX4095649.1 helix-turn-helix domain containing protein [Nocardia sp. alder85J]